ncbi:MAG TPA: flagellar basal body rod protein FlgB [Candidatus Binatus sp.]|nr:flagellar basal body rod protein FlgB [Candidatus Binatus sp.]
MPTTIFDPTFHGLAEALTLHQRRHEVLASNLANVETPRFRARDLDFEAALKEAFEGGRSDALAASSAPRVVEDLTAPPRADGNTVDLDLQMAKLGANGGRYVALARILALRIALLRQAIEGGRP